MLNLGERDTPEAEIASGRSDSKRVRNANAFLIPLAGLVTQASAPKCRGGSFNASWRRESPGGDTEEPEADTFRVPWKQGRE